MIDLEVRVENLEPMCVASFRATGKAPEKAAWEKLRAWAEPLELLGDLAMHPIFGFNNPQPSPGRKEYGYEFWIRVDSETEIAPKIERKDFPGGLYAATTCRLVGDPRGTVQEIWMQLWDWVQLSKYKWRQTHELEKLHDPLAGEDEMVLDLYLPIEEY